MFFKNLRKTFTMLLLTLLIMPTFAFAYSDYIYAGGENIGIQLNAKGVMIVGLYKVDGMYLASNAGLKIGDVIMKIDDQDVTTTKEMVNIISNAKEKIKVEVKREEEKLTINLPLYRDNDGIIKTGLYVKDNITGIGTLSFIDPNTKLFGALGHEIIEKSTGEILEIKDGKIFSSIVTNIEPSQDGTPGEKNATFYPDQVKGDIFSNTSKGIFGTYSSSITNKKLYKVAKADEIKKGNATMLTVLDGEQIGEYAIKITKISTNNQKTKNLTFEITDPILLEKAGGIVQGMSGSPIIQNDMIIGAVTHVVVENPIKGYGILITNMLEEAENGVN